MANMAVLLGLGAAAFFMMQRGGGPGGTPAQGLITLRDGTRIAPNGNIYDPQGRLIRAGLTVDYARAVAQHGAEIGQNPAVTLAIIKGVAGLAPALIQSITNVLNSPSASTPTSSGVSISDQLRSEIIADPSTVNPADFPDFAPSELAALDTTLAPIDAPVWNPADEAAWLF